MDLKIYYRKLREVEASIDGPFPLVVSTETADGGKPGVLSEVPRAAAARMIVEGRAMLANPLQQQEYRQQQAAAQKAAKKAELARRVQVAIISDPNLDDARTDIGSKVPVNGGN